MSDSPLRIIFVCSGNICRSPVAHRLFERLAAERGVAHRFHAESAGTGAWHLGEDADSRMRAVAKRHGWTLHHGVRQLTHSDLEEYDLILAMDRGHRRDIARMVSARPTARQPSGVADAADLTAKVRLFREFDPEAGTHLDVPDPYYDGQEAFETVYKICERTCRALLDAWEQGRLGA